MLLLDPDEKLLDPDKYEESILFGTLEEPQFLKELTTIFEKFSDLIDSFYEKYRNFPVVNPTKEKFSDTVFQQHYYQLLRMLSFELENKIVF